MFRWIGQPSHLPSSSSNPASPHRSGMFSKKKKKVEISAPSNFQHRVHTGFDNSAHKFVGLPKQWASLVTDEAGAQSQHREEYFQ